METGGFGHIFTKNGGMGEFGFKITGRFGFETKIFLMKGSNPHTIRPPKRPGLN